MIRGEVVRQAPTQHGTPGRMTLENGFSCDTLELPWRDNERGKSCTAPGVDRGRVWWSPTLRRLVIRYEDRNGRRDCLVHNGNWAGDVDAGDITQVHGCTEVGNGYGDLQRPDKRTQWGVLHSGATLAGLIESLRDERVEAGLTDAHGFVAGYHDVEITYRWAP